ncbi:MAG: hypothetical protein ACKVPJ_07100 [Chitinophagales bacterium]
MRKKIFIDNTKLHSIKHIVAAALCWMASTTAMAQADVTKLPPLDELGTGTYEGYTGGLYPNGSNQMPPGFYNDAIKFAQSIQPLNTSGKPDANGKVGLVTIGASTVAMFSDGIEKFIYDVPGLKQEIVFVNGGIGGQDLNKIYDQQGKYWITVESRVAAAGLSNAQVQIVWLQEDDLKYQSAAFPDRADFLADAFTYVVQKLKIRYPNLKFVYLTARHTTLWMPADAKAKHKEPRAYLNGWATKFLIERQINGDAELSYKGDDAKAPILLWGPYFWTQGDKPRSDGYTFSADLLSNDGVHPNELGKIKVANDLINFWKTDAVSQLWFLENPEATIPVTTTASNNTETKNPVNYMRLYILQQEVERIDRALLTEKLRIIILKDSSILSSEEYFVNDSINIRNIEPGVYKYLIKDEANFIIASKFIVTDQLDVKKESNALSPGTNTGIDSTKGKNLVGLDEPAWFINGENKLPKLIKLLGGDRIAKAVFTKPDGTVVLEVEDALHKHTVVNDKLEPGQYVLKFYDESGALIDIERAIPEFIRIK